MITHIPVGGLANRMRAIASAVSLAEEINNNLRIIWFRDWAMKAKFNKLFEKIELSLIDLKEATYLDLLINDRPRRRNLYFPYLPQTFLYNNRIYEDSVAKACENDFDLRKWAKDKNVYISSFYQFVNYNKTLIKKIFVPKYEIREQIESYNKLFNQNTIGVHIRRTDNNASIKNSPIELFIEIIDLNIKENDETNIFLATDSIEVKDLLLKRYGSRIITSSNNFKRDSFDGVRDGVIDMFTLANTKKIYGSFGSSFSELASQINNVPLEIVHK